jgi:type I restriction enzyme S subunit
MKHRFSEKDDLPELPESWEWMNFLDSITQISISNNKLKKGEYIESGEFPVIDQGEEFIGGYTNESVLAIQVDQPVIIFGDHTKNVKYVDFPFVPGADGIKVFEPQNQFHPKCLYYFLRHLPLPDKGYSRHYKYLKESFIPLPPISEQARIVEKIDELFSRLDAGVTDLKDASKRIDMFQQSILHEVLEGRLIRRYNGEQSQSKSSSYAELTSNKEDAVYPKYIDRPSIPNRWQWSSLEQLFSFRNGDELPKDKRNPGEHPVFGGNGKIDTNDVWNIESKALVIGRVGANCGNIHIASPKSWVTDNAIYTDDVKVDVSFSYLKILLSYYPLNSLSGGTGQPYISQKTLKGIDIPLPPLAEQKMIADQLDAILSMISKISEVLDTELQRSERLRHSILKSAFEARLIPQNPDEKSANQLGCVKRTEGKLRKGEQTNLKEVMKDAE